MDDDVDEPDRETITRACAILLDLVSAMDTDDVDTYPDSWAQPFAAELAQLGAVTALIDNATEPPAIRVDITPLMAATAYVMDVLVRSIATDRGVDRLAVISSVRSAVAESA